MLIEFVHQHQLYIPFFISILTGKDNYGYDYCSLIIKIGNPRRFISSTKKIQSSSEENWIKKEKLFWNMKKL